MTKDKPSPSGMRASYRQTGQSRKVNELGMNAMQERAYEKRGEPYLLIKSPPASGKSRALMFIALDKVHNQALRKAIIAVPETTIGASFSDQPLSQFGFPWDWTVQPRWNLCNAPGGDKGKVAAVQAFLQSENHLLVTTHATFRFAIERFGVDAFDHCLLAIDECHHSSPDNKLGTQLSELIARDKVHIVAMTGSYFRGDAEPVLMPDDEAKFDTVTYTYYEQLNGYQYLKDLDIGYYLYKDHYVDSILEVLDANEKTIVHIPNVNARESVIDKHRQVEHILEALGTWQGIDPVTGFQLVQTADGRVLRIADLVDDDPAKRGRVVGALKDPRHKDNRDHVDIIVALGMAKEGFDWIWCEHALTVGYRSSLTEIVQIIGRVTRDAPHKSRVRFTNLIAEPDASEEIVTEAVNDTLKAIAASLLMEQVLAPKISLKPKHAESGPIEGLDYGEGGYDAQRCNVGVNADSGEVHVEVKGLKEPKSKEAQRACREDLLDLQAALIQDKQSIERGLFDEYLMPQELTLQRMGKIIRDRYPNFDEDDQETVRQHAIAVFNVMQEPKRRALEHDNHDNAKKNTDLIDGIRKFVTDVRELDIDLIDSINPFKAAYAILAKSMNEDSLKQIISRISENKYPHDLEELRLLARRAVQFKQECGRFPSRTASDPWERLMAEGAATFRRIVEKAKAESQAEA